MVVSDFQVPWNKLYRRKLLENLRYPENKAFEDTCLMPVIYAERLLPAVYGIFIQLPHHFNDAMHARLP